MDETRDRREAPRWPTPAKRKEGIEPYSPESRAWQADRKTDRLRDGRARRPASTPRSFPIVDARTLARPRYARARRARLRLSTPMIPRPTCTLTRDGYGHSSVRTARRSTCEGTSTRDRRRVLRASEERPARRRTTRCRRIGLRPTSTSTCGATTTATTGRSMFHDLLGEAARQTHARASFALPGDLLERGHDLAALRQRDLVPLQRLLRRGVEAGCSGTGFSIHGEVTQ